MTAPSNAGQSATLTGVVLCGGESRRMRGNDKALLRYAGRTWCELACEKLEALGLPVVLSVRASQLSEFQERFPARTCVVDAHPIPGPLGALLSVFACARSSLFVLATDMPSISDAALRDLRDRFVSPEFQSARSGGVCFGDSERIEPLCACYSGDALTTLTAVAPQLERHDLQQLRERLNLLVIAPASAWEAELRSFNSPEDLLI